PVEIIYRLRFKALHVPHCHPFKHGFYLTGAQSAPSFAEQAVRTPARAGMTVYRFPRRRQRQHRNQAPAVNLPR
ncbi:hypothetical protein, partial [Neisseria gonorrhoeae]|uniref:hypothetical protein n=1 Tax=Neisseria gonorrhoeae TaxID=485 RepID=UPI002804F165